MVLDVAARTALSVAADELASVCGGRAVFPAVPPRTIFTAQTLRAASGGSEASAKAAAAQSRAWRLARMAEVAEWLASRCVPSRPVPRPPHWRHAFAGCSLEFMSAFEQTRKKENE